VYALKVNILLRVRLFSVSCFLLVESGVYAFNVLALSFLLVVLADA